MDEESFKILFDSGRMRTVKNNGSEQRRYVLKSSLTLFLPNKVFRFCQFLDTRRTVQSEKARRPLRRDVSKGVTTNPTCV